jgi:hypothetical protein
MFILEQVGTTGMDEFWPERERVYFYKVGNDRMKIRSYYTKEDRNRFYKCAEDQVVSTVAARHIYKAHLMDGFNPY